jgi:hypothetical protein|eukprot:SAG25_NODE_1393_length_3141_cov_10.875082_4_plen_65_part_00
MQLIGSDRWIQGIQSNGCLCVWSVGDVVDKAMLRRLLAMVQAARPAALSPERALLQVGHSCHFD